MIPTRRYLLIGWLVMCTALGACTQERVVYSGWDSWAKTVGADSKPQPGQNKHNQDPTGGKGWSIVVQRYSGANRYARAQALIDKLRRAAQLDGLWIQDIDNQVTVYYGRFKEQFSDAATFALADIQQITLGEEQPFVDAILEPLVDKHHAISDPLNLKQHIGYFTLQVGYYDSNFGNGFREAAEQAAKTLRQDGEQAYYYHGPHRSLITIGLFTYDDFVKRGKTEVYGPRIKTLQEKYPYNLGNGRQMIEKVRGQEIGAQESCLVRVF